MGELRGQIPEVIYGCGYVKRTNRADLKFFPFAHMFEGVGCQGTKGPLRHCDDESIRRQGDLGLGLSRIYSGLWDRLVHLRHLFQALHKGQIVF